MQQNIVKVKVVGYNEFSVRGQGCVRRPASPPRRYHH